jgi:hypothetical protein
LDHLDDRDGLDDRYPDPEKKVETVAPLASQWFEFRPPAFPSAALGLADALC